MIQVEAFSEAGGHHQNEDAFAIGAHPNDPDLRLCFLADGQGGQPGGGPAARLACQAGLRAATALPPRQLSDPATWSGLLRVADEAVGADDATGYTTLVGLCASRGWVVGASSGDSAALLLCGQAAAELTSGQRKNPPVGSGMAVAVPFCAPVVPPWKALVMSDGAWKYVGWERIIEAARRQGGSALVAGLQRLARLPGSGRFPDDFPVVVLECPA